MSETEQDQKKESAPIVAEAGKSGSTEALKPSADAKSPAKEVQMPHQDDLPEFDTENGLCYPHAVGSEHILGETEIKK